jgi:ornithine cyclodeaminase/alanine dehydrogenase-like protein (mu-crystallin family)
VSERRAGPSGLPYLDGAALGRLVGPEAAVDALERALLDGSAPGRTPPRTHVDAGHGQVLLMPSEIGAWWGLKAVSIAPENPAAGLPRIQGVYLLMEAGTLTPRLLVDGVALTTLRTPAVSALALRHLAPGPVRRLLVFGSGPQGLGHVDAVRAAGPDRAPLDRVTVVCRDVGRGTVAVQGFRAEHPDLPEIAVLAAGDPGVAEVLAEADVVVCATTAREPLFDSALLGPQACVVAVGSHEPAAREVDSALVARATVVVESQTAGPREGGDLVIPQQAGELPDGFRAHDLADLVAGRVAVAPGRPRFFKSCGEAWEDLIVASRAADQYLAAP